MDNRINGSPIAEKISSTVRYKAPAALVGLISSTVDDDQIKFYQDLGYNFVIKKE